MADGKIVATIKAGASYDAPWLVFSGDTAQEVTHHIAEAQRANLLGTAALAGSVFTEIFKGIGPVDENTPLDSLSVSIPPTGQTQQQMYSQPQQPTQAGYGQAPWPNEQPQAQAQRYQPTPPAPMQAAPTCQHGQKQFKQGTSQKTGKPYRMWACPSTDRNNQCTAEFLK